MNFGGVKWIVIDEGAEENLRLLQLVDDQIGEPETLILVRFTSGAGWSWSRY